MYLKDSVWLVSLNDEHFNHATETGWIKHVEHGWLYAAPGSRTENGVWLWDDIQQGWFWTSPELYPLIFSDADGMWLYYEEGGTPESRDFQIYNGTGWGSSRNVR